MKKNNQNFPNIFTIPVIFHPSFASTILFFLPILAINPADNEFDVVYINGDHNIPTVLTQTAEEDGATRVLKPRQIEPEFLERMFSVEDV